MKRPRTYSSRPTEPGRLDWGVRRSGPEGAPPRFLDTGLPGAFGRLKLRGELGAGGMGRVLEAWDPDLGRAVAVKLLALRDEDGELAARFVNEARLTSRLEHPNVVPVYDVGVTEDGRAWFVMKKIEGRTLGEVLARLRAGEPDTARRWGFRRLVTAFLQACQAVAFAHQRGVVHRDLKPDNVMLGPFGEVLVLDWGLARESAAPAPADSLRDPPSLPGWAAARPVTQSGRFVGTPGYMSPEQALGDVDVDARADVWSLGAVLFELLTGERAWPGDEPYAVLQRSCTEAPPDPRVLAPARRVPDELAELVLRAMDRDRERRPAHAGELVEAIEAWLDGSQRRARAQEQLRGAEAEWRRFLALDADQRGVEARERDAGRKVEPWSRGPEKEALLALRDRGEALAVEVAEAFASAVARGERALSQDPGMPEASAFLAGAWWWRFEEAEARNDRAAMALAAARVRAYDDGRLAAQLTGEGTLSVEAAGLRVRARPWAQRGLAWSLGEVRELGVGPLSGQRLPLGSWRIELGAPGFEPALVPVQLSRGRGARVGPVPLLRPGALADGFVYVPGGPVAVGGDPAVPRQLPAAEHEVAGFAMARFPVRVREWLEFLNALQVQDPEDARRRAPRREHAMKGQGEPWWPVPAPGEAWVLPAEDGDGDTWDPDFPVFSVSWDDAVAYAAWRSARDGRRYRLPTELEWEKAARGVDRRFFPWGNRFDPTACKMELSRPGRPRPEPVGAYLLDESPYGVRDLAGGVREWCQAEDFDGDPTRRPVRGGCWSGAEKLCRAANRFGYERWVTHGYIGVRLVEGEVGGRGP